MRRSMLGSGRITALLVMGASALVAQGTQIANVSGEVIGKDGAPVAGVMVRLTSPSLQGTRVVTSDAKGRFAARLLPPGTYTIVLTKDGMQQVKATTTIGIGQTFEPRYTMASVGGTVVEVVASAGEIDKTDTKTATNYALDKVDQLPNGRTMEAVALLTPGVTVGVGGRVQIRGAMTSGNLYLLDGQNISDNAYNSKGVRTIDDAIEEVQVITGAISAEYGDVDGGVMNAITRSGGNEFAGQLRWELRNPQWDCYQPKQALNSINNKLSESKTLSVSGFIIKDKLWFAGSYFSTEVTTPQTITINLASRGGVNPVLPKLYGYAAPFDYSSKEIRRTVKLTYSINQNHTLVSSFSNSQQQEANRNYGAGELASLVPQLGTSDFFNLQWRAVWSNSLTSEVKIGSKHQLLSAGGAANGISPKRDLGAASSAYYDNGIFNNTDGGDNRNNKSFNAKVSYFLDAMGSHQIDGGIDYLRQISKARNEQTPTGFIFGIYSTNLDNRTALVDSIWTYGSTEGEALNDSTALYINDKWSLNKFLTFNIGVRFDSFKAMKEDGATTASANAISPRLGLKYDVVGDAKYVFGAAYSVYNAKAATSVLNNVTGQGNPWEIDYYYIGGAGRMPFATIDALATNWQTSGNFDTTTPAYYSNALVNVKLADNLKAPQVSEMQASFQYAFNFPSIGNGFVKVTGVKKSWKNLFDYRQGNDGTVSTPTGPVYMRVWENSDLAKREYKGLELEGQLSDGPWSIGGNATWSELRGNYEGEGTSQPGRGEGLKSYTIQDGVAMYDNSVINAPYGYLAGHVPLRIRANASYVSNNAWGKTTWGLVYRFDSGSRYSIARSVTKNEVNPALNSGFGSTATQFLGERGGGGVYNSSVYTDLAVTQDFPLFKVYGKTVNGFLKLVISNVFNHQQKLTWDTSYLSAAASTPGYNPPTVPSLGLNAPWVKAGTYNTSGSSGNYGAARTYAISTGFRF